MTYNNRWILIAAVAALAVGLTAAVAYAAPQSPYANGSQQGYPGWWGMGTGMMGGNARGMMVGGNALGPGQCGQYMSGYGQWNYTQSRAYIVMARNSFYPASMTVKAGTTVTWVNMDLVAHTVTSGSEEAPTNLFDSHELGHMGSFSYTFDTPGTYSYYCDIHPAMVGSVTVTQ